MNVVAVEPAKTGDLSARFGAQRIHSLYDPRKEARRFIAGGIDDYSRNAVVVIVGGALGYLADELSKQRPDLSIISFHLIPELWEFNVAKGRSVKTWSPKDGRSPEDFLLTSISELNLPGLKVLEWPASIRCAPEEARRVKSAISSVVRRYSGNITTTRVFGRLWIRNTFRNYTEIDGFAVPAAGTGATVIAASGPSLETHIEELCRNRDRFELWALPSSLSALGRANIRPDLIFTTDPGFWARIHGRGFNRDIPLAMPLSAAPMASLSKQIVLLKQGAPGEDALLGGEDWPGIDVPEAGSVAITAIETWRKQQRGPLVLVGLDLSWYDLIGHARPHSFDGWFSIFDRRTRPSLTTKWKNARRLVPNREGRWRTGPSMATYADWFRFTEMAGEVYRLCSPSAKPLPRALPGVEDVGSELFARLPRCRKSTYQYRLSPVSSEERRRRVVKVLRRWEQIAVGQRSPDPSDREAIYALDPGTVLEMVRNGDDVPRSVDEERQDHLRKIIQRFLQSYER